VEPDDPPLVDPEPRDDPPEVEPLEEFFDDVWSLEESELLDESLEESLEESFFESWSESELLEESFEASLSESLAESLEPSESLPDDFADLGSLLPLATLATSASNSSASGLPIQLIMPLVSTMKAQGMPFWPAACIHAEAIERSAS
jgi:hypothetical protein